MTTSNWIQLGILVTTFLATLFAGLRALLTAFLVVEGRLIRLETIVLRSKELDDSGHSDTHGR